jgi:hypothetical protein
MLHACNILQLNNITAGKMKFINNILFRKFAPSKIRAQYIKYDYYRTAEHDCKNSGTT